MNNTMKLKLTTMAMILGSVNAFAGEVLVTQGNYATIETSRQYEIQIGRAGGVNKLNHSHGTAKVDDQPIIRLNQDTVYSMGVIDTSKGGTIVIPEMGDRFVSVQFLDEKHNVYPAVYGAGEHAFPEYEGHMYVLVRIASITNSTKEDAEIYNYQKAIQIKANSNKAFQPIDYDDASLQKVHKEMLATFNQGQLDVTQFFGTDVPDLNRHVGAAVGWAGGQKIDNVWNMSPNTTDFSCLSTTFEDPKNIGGFWSITAYNEQGFLFTNNNVNSFTAEPNEDSTYTVHFGCEGKKNNIVIENETGKWNAIIRAYKPSTLVQSGEWLPLKTVNPI